MPPSSGLAPSPARYGIMKTEITVTVEKLITIDSFGVVSAVFTEGKRFTAIMVGSNDKDFLSAVL